MPNDLYAQIVAKIIQQQESIIGPIAIEQAKRVAELRVDWPEHQVDFTGDPQAAIDHLVEQYKELFGQIAVEACKDAAGRLITQLPAEKQPHSLQ